MASDYLDYENNLAFPPQEVKSQDDIKQEGRQSEVLIKALEKCEKLEKENQQLKELLKECGQKFFEAEGNYGFDDSIVDICSPMIDKITNAIGEK